MISLPSNDTFNFGGINWLAFVIVIVVAILAAQLIPRIAVALLARRLRGRQCRWHAAGYGTVDRCHSRRGLLLHLFCRSRGIGGIRYSITLFIRRSFRSCGRLCRPPFSSIFIAYRLCFRRRLFSRFFINYRFSIR